MDNHLFLHLLSDALHPPFQYLPGLYYLFLFTTFAYDFCFYFIFPIKYLSIFASSVFHYACTMYSVELATKHFTAETVCMTNKSLKSK